MNDHSLDVSLRLSAVLAKTEAAEAVARNAWLDAADQFERGEISRSDFKRAERAHLAASRATRDARFKLWRHDEPETMKENCQLRDAFQKDENWIALHTAIRISYTHPVDYDDAPFNTEMYYVPDWVLDACYDLATAKLTDASKGRGRRQWVTRYRQQLEDQRKWVVYQWGRKQGLSFEQSMAAAAEYSGVPEPTLRKAVERIERLRAKLATESDELPVYKPANPPGTSYADPFKGEFDSFEFDVSHFDRIISMIRERRPPYGKGADRILRLIEITSEHRRLVAPSKKRSSRA